MTPKQGGKYDQIFEEEGRGLPVPFLRALAKRESSLNPRENTGPAWGLMQVGISPNAGDVLKNYNRRMGTSLSPNDMLDPRLNVRVAADLLSRIVKLYGSLGVRADWSNPNFVGLLVAGWNSGYSRKAGVGRVIQYLRGRSLPVTFENVWKYAQFAGATKHLTNDRKKRWQESVVRQYFSELGTPLKKGIDEWIPLLLLLLLVR